MRMFGEAATFEFGRAVVSGEVVYFFFLCESSMSVFFLRAWAG